MKKQPSVVSFNSRVNNVTINEDLAKV